MSAILRGALPAVYRPLPLSAVRFVLFVRVYAHCAEVEGGYNAVCRLP